MSCPYKHWNFITNSWRCKLALQDCPEATLEGFDFEQCSTYQEEESEKKHKLQKEVEIQ